MTSASCLPVQLSHLPSSAAGGATAVLIESCWRGAEGPIATEPEMMIPSALSILSLAGTDRACVRVRVCVLVLASSALQQHHLEVIS